MSFVSTEKVRIANLASRDVVGLGRAPYTDWLGRLRPGDRAVGDRALNLVGMGGFADKPMDRLSDGAAQRVMIARALAQDTPVLLLDEPTSALDPELVGEVEKSIVDAAKSGQTMILVSHDMNFIYQVADKVLFLEKGHILEQGTPDEIFNHPKEERTKEFFASYSKQYL